MTGFGAAMGTVGARRISVEIRSVNHRFFNATIRLPIELSRWEGDVREALKKKVARGHVTLSARAESADPSAIGIDEARFAAYVARVRALKQKYELDGDVDVGSILRLPEVFTSSVDEDDATSPQLVALVEAAGDSLAASRLDEGRRLGTYLLERLGIIEAALQRIAQRAPERIVAQRDKLRDAVKELTEGLAVDEQRLAMEIAILADRLDVHEELSRFSSHILAFKAALTGTSGDPVGKKLGFLLQEMVREANTTGSKANDATMVGDVVIVKEELERLREQVENLE
ncbi:MAG: YicC/YloC family endoribonuclease [Gemmatimonadaceae bacterium]